MKTTEHESQTNRRESGFTLQELLTLIVMIAFLALLPMSAISVSREEVHRGQCASNLRQAAMALHILGTESNGRLPSAGAGISGAWMWDVSAPTADSIARYIPRERLYCPGSGFTRAENERLWDFGLFRVLGYAPTLSGAPGIFASNVNLTITPQRAQVGITLVPAPHPAQRVLWADATISRGQSYVDIFGAYRHRTPHMDGALPLGGNVAMLDGHVEWRPFAQMRVRCSNTPTFWW